MMITLALAIDRHHTTIPFVASSSILTIIIFTHKKEINVIKNIGLTNPISPVTG